MAENSRKQGLTTTHKILIAGFLVVIAVIVFLFFYFNKKDEPAPEASPNVLTEANLAELEDDLEAQRKKTQFRTQMNTKWSFPDGSAPSSDAVVGNSSANQYDFYITVTLEDTGEEIYKSGIVPVGRRLKEIVLDKELSAGKYSALCKYHLIDENGEEVETAFDFKVTITIES